MAQMGQILLYGESTTLRWPVPGRRPVRRRSRRCPSRRRRGLVRGLPSPEPV